MDVDYTTEAPLTERKVVRRGLLTGIAALGAAVMVQLSGAGKAEAANNDPLLIGNMGPAPAPGATQTATAETRLTVTAVNGLQIRKDSGGVFSASLAAIIGSDGSASGTGVMGNATSGTGVEGRTGTGRGVHGAGLTDGIGVLGESFGAINAGVEGRSNLLGSGFAGTGSGNGVNGYSGTGKAIYGLAVSGTAVYGQSTSGAGVFGQSVSQPGVDGVSTNSLGVRCKSTNFVGIVGISTNSHGLYGSTHVGVNGYGIVAENLGANGPGLLVTGSAPSQVFGGLQVFGPKNAVLKMQDSTFASVYCQESPEPYFEDFGRAQLVAGVANVALEREFATLVAGGDYMVFPVAEGETRGLFVSRRTPGGFEVREMQGGVGNVPFTYRIVTRRKDIEGKRFARVDTSAAEKVAGVRAVLSGMGSAGPSSGPSSGPSAPLPTQPGLPPIMTNTPPSSSVAPSGPGYTNVPPGGGPSSTNPNTGY